MTNLANKIQHSSTGVTGLGNADLVSAGEVILKTTTSNIESEELLELAAKLISIYDAPAVPNDLRTRAARIVGKLAAQQSKVLELVIENAKGYVKEQQLDDADPYNPNSFDVLSEIRPVSEAVVSFLRKVMKDNWGTPRWAAIEALSRLDDPAADTILADFVKGAYPCVYPSRDFDFDHAIRIVEHRKGRAFIDLHQL